ncbi:GtrA family protein [Microvirga sp. ACRRW]|uniref:GtrA family protein n=1 Tax=Microvirga sp. ACRRW TaxID=2918205 RepID=UPI001EF714D3|nr:GtrA family protein [Microvirga sp. ACRRW]MCG7392681.1 GtrA family protein [Microvirga sp. ACRRW]
MQLIRFILVGVLNTAVGFSFIIGAMQLLHLDYRLANALGYAAGCIVGFLLNRTWTFQFSGAWWSSAARWFAVVAVCYLLNLATVIFIREVFLVDTILAQACGVLVYTAASFVGGKFFAFRSHRPIATGQAS